jgi:hypothetical protein
MSIGGMPWGLAQAERSLGLDSKVLYSSSSQFSYPSDLNLHLEKTPSLILHFYKLMKTFMQIRNHYEVFHFNYGRSLIHITEYKVFHLELPLYPKRVKLFVTYNGCDARQKFPTIKRTKISACHYSECYGGLCNSGDMDRIRRRSIAKMAKYVRHMWAVNPDLLYFLPKEKSSFLPYSVNSDNITIAKPNFSEKKLRIVHAPTERAVKGSNIILATLEELKKDRSSEIDFEIVENLPHEQAIEVFGKADLVIDQILVGWYGGVAVEVMSMGKPVICRIAEEDLHFIPEQMAADLKDAFIHGEETNLKEVILRCIEDREFLKRKSEAALDYARTWHAPEYVASITKKAYESY